MLDHMLVVVSLHKDNDDFNGTIYPEAGFIEFKGYEQNNNISTGLCGTLWGVNRNRKWLISDEDSIWLVVQIDNNEDIIVLDKDNQFVKFKSGLIVHRGIEKSCRDYVEVKGSQLGYHPETFELNTESGNTESELVTLES